MTNISKSKMAFIAGVAVLAMFAFAFNPILISQKTSAWSGWNDDDWGHGWGGHHHWGGHWHDWDDCDDWDD